MVGHEEIASQISTHAHHGDHAHDHDSGGKHTTDETRDDQGSGKGFIHDHSPSLSLASAWMVSDEVVFEICFSRVGHLFDHTIAPITHSRPESVLRPPRAA